MSMPCIYLCVSTFRAISNEFDFWELISEYEFRIPIYEFEFGISTMEYQFLVQIWVSSIYEWEWVSTIIIESTLLTYEYESGVDWNIVVDESGFVPELSLQTTNLGIGICNEKERSTAAGKHWVGTKG